MDEKPPERRALQFGLRTLLELIAVAGFVVALMFARKEPPAEGRYQKAADKLVLDTYTGQIWQLSSNGQIWYRAGAPPAADE